ncbi:hypothetical protein Avbf_10075, partial [Armadillidium vulgare]
MDTTSGLFLKTSAFVLERIILGSEILITLGGEMDTTSGLFLKISDLVLERVCCCIACAFPLNLLRIVHCYLLESFSQFWEVELKEYFEVTVPDFEV